MSIIQNKELSILKIKFQNRYSDSEKKRNVVNIGIKTEIYYRRR